MMAYMVTDFQQHSDSKLADSVGAVGGNIAYNHPMLLRGRNINNVIASGEHADKF